MKNAHFERGIFLFANALHILKNRARKAISSVDEPAFRIGALNTVNVKIGKIQNDRF